MYIHVYTYITYIRTNIYTKIHSCAHAYPIKRTAPTSAW